jgi:hypothetical protein
MARDPGTIALRTSRSERFLVNESWSGRFWCGTRTIEHARVIGQQAQRLLRQADSATEAFEAGMRAKRVSFRFDAEEDHAHVASIEGFFKRIERCIHLAQTEERTRP